MSCQELNIILDTCVFVFWCSGEPGYGQVMDCIREGKIKIVLCPELEKEYQRQLDPRYYGAGYQVLKSKKDQLFREEVLLYVGEEITNDIIIQKKDQHVMNCAFNGLYPVSIIVTDNTPDFIAEKPYRLPIILTTQDFLDGKKRQTICSDAKLVWEEIRRVGNRARFI